MVCTILNLVYSKGYILHMSELQTLNLVYSYFLSYFYFIFYLFLILELRIRVSMTLYVTVTQSHNHMSQ